MEVSEQIRRVRDAYVALDGVPNTIALRNTLFQLMVGLVEQEWRTAEQGADTEEIL